jgi:hypothetical protein
MNAKRFIIIISTIIIAIISGVLAGNNYQLIQYRKLEAWYIAGCAIHANTFNMEERYKITKSGLPLVYFTFVRYERACGLVDYMNYVINSDKFWKEGGIYYATPEDQIEAKQKLHELFGSEVTMEDVLERSYDVKAFLDILPTHIVSEIINDGGTDRENRF